MNKRTHEQLVQIALSRPEVKKEYDALEEEFAVIEQMIRIRISKNKTQEDVARYL